MSDQSFDDQNAAVASADQAVAVDPPSSSASPTQRPQRKRSRRFLRWLIPVVAVVVIGGTVGGILIANHAKATTNQPQTITRDVQAQTITMATTISATGTIEPTKRADLTFSSSGTVTAVDVSVGDKVTTGQVLATIDQTDLQAAVDSAQAAVDAAQSDYDSAVSSGVTAQINAANSTLTAKQNTLTNAQTALGAATMTAPFDGTVAIMTMAVGDSVGSGGGGGGNQGGYSQNTSSSSSTDTITVISTDLYSVSTSVGASDVQQLAKGMAATVTPNDSTTAMDGTVTSVGVIATSSTSSGATFPVMIDITDAQPGLYAGVSASITITLSSQDVLAVPTTAVSQSGGQSTVELVTGDTTTTTVVTTGDRQNGMVAITSGLQAGDTVRVTVTFGGNGGGANNPSGFSTLFGSGNRPGGYSTNGNFSGGQMPDFSGGQGPNFSGGQMPNFSGQGNG